MKFRILLPLLGRADEGNAALLAIEKFFGKDTVGIGTSSFWIVFENGLAETWCFADANGARDGCREDYLLEMGADIAHNGGTDVCPHIKQVIRRPLMARVGLAPEERICSMTPTNFPRPSSA